MIVFILAYTKFSFVYVYEAVSPSPFARKIHGVPWCKWLVLRFWSERLRVRSRRSAIFQTGRCRKAVFACLATDIKQDTFTFILAGCHVRASAGDLVVHGALIPCACVCVCVCVRYQTPFSSRHESGPSLFLSTGKHPVVGQLPRVSFSALPGQSSDRPNLPPYPSAITALFLDRSLVVVHLPGHDQMMTVEILRTMAIAAPTACRMPVDLLAVATGAASNRVRFAGSVSCFTSIAIDHPRRSSLVVRSCQRSIGKCFDCKQTTSHAWCCVCMQVNETGHAQRLNMLKQRPRKWFFREEVDFLSSLAFVVN